VAAPHWRTPMPTSADFPYPRRYNSLRLLGFDYGSTSALFFVTIDTDASRPVFGDLKLARAILAALLDARTQARIRLLAFTLMPDHLHIEAGVREAGKSLSAALAAFKSFTTQLYWKRSREIVSSQTLALAHASGKKSSAEEARAVLPALMEWRAVLRPEVVELRNWPQLHPEQFLGKHLWHTKFNDHIIRNDDDLRETIKYIAFNPVKRGYVSKPQFYPFTGFGAGVQ